MILATDLGSTSFKAAVFTPELKVVGTGSGTLEYHLAEGGVVELNVDKSDALFRRAIIAALQTAGIEPSLLTGIAIASQAQTFTVVGADQRPKAPFISWQDTRPGDDHRAGRELPDFAAHSSVGSCLSLLMVAKLAHLQDQFDGKLVQESDRVLPLPSWFFEKLCGQALIDDNLAAMSGLYSLQQSDWWDDALAVCGINRRQLPVRKPLGKVAAETTDAADRYGLTAGIPLILAGNDQTAGAYGAGIHDSDAVLLTLGTAQVVYVCRDQLPPPKADVMRGPYPGQRYYQLAADECGGSTINWFKTHADNCPTDDDFARLANAVSDAAGLRFRPGGDAGSGEWIGLTATHDSRHQARAILECLTDRLMAMVQRLDLDLAVRSILIAGGGRHCKPWVDCLKTQLGPVQSTDASPLEGAAAMTRDALNGVN